MAFQLWHLLARSAERFPERTAVRMGERAITYAELDSLSSRLAATLVNRGVQRGDRVGIFMKKTPMSVVSIFGILKAGAVYVPIDPGSPKSRLAYIIGNCGIRHLLVGGDRLEMLTDALADAGAEDPASVIIVDEIPAGADTAPGLVRWAEVEAAPARAPSVSGVESDLAYILYTSGSTGVPKGVMISHRAAFTFIDWTHDCFEITERDRVSSHAPLHFDLSIFDIFTTIKAGGAIVQVPDRMSTFPVVLAKFIRDERITAWYSVPSALTLMLEKGKFASYAYPDLRVVLFAGEVFPIKYLRALRRATTARLCNLYGPTETNVCTWYEVGDDIPDERTTPIPIGRAIANYRVFALSEQGAEIRPGETGELLARGPGLMAGYWGDAEKTARGLVPNPLPSPIPADTVYRTGDIVGVDEAGDYLYIGRRDNMVKSRGYRIELGDIETALYAHAGIKEAAVIAIPDDEITNRLKAFVVSEPAGALSAQEVQQHCLQHVPRYMIPELVEFRSELPKTSTGKVDRQALSSASAAGSPSTSSALRP